MLASAILLHVLQRLVVTIHCGMIHLKKERVILILFWLIIRSEGRFMTPVQALDHDEATKSCRKQLREQDGRA